MRKIFVLWLLVLCLMCTGCQYDFYQDVHPNVNTSPSPGLAIEKPSFLAKVLEVYENSCLVRPLSGEDELKCADKITVPMYCNIGLVPGDYVVIKYTGEILETYPAQLGSAEISIYQEAIVDLPWLSTIDADDYDTLLIELVGLTKDEVRSAWGTPHGMTPSMDGDVWFGGATREVCLTVFYDNAQHFTRIEILDEALSMRNFEYAYLGATDSGNPFYLSLCTDGTFNYGVGNPGYYIGMGYWRMSENGMLCLREADTSTERVSFVRTNYFRVRGAHLVWIAEGSDGFPGLQLKDGAIFPASYNTQ